MWKTSKPVSSGVAMIALLARANARAKTQATPPWQTLRAAQALQQPTAPAVQ